MLLKDKYLAFFILIFAIALFVLSLTSCELCDCEEYEPVYYVNSEQRYTGNGDICMLNNDHNADEPILPDAILRIGFIMSGGLDLYLPTNEDLLFLAKLDPNTSPGMYTEPLDVEVWLYEKPLILINDGMYIGDLEYRMIDENKYHKIFYWYFSKDAKINHSTGSSECRYSIDAKKGWNKVYFYKNIADGKTCYTTDLSKAPDGLKWFFSPSSQTP